MTDSVFKKIDCYSIHVDFLDAGIAFYKKLGHDLVWRDGEHSAGLSMPDSDGELVLHTDNRPFETCLLVDTVDSAIESIVSNGGKLVFGPIQIKVGKYALLNDPWGNPLPILDFSSGLLLTDSEGNVIGNQK
ncbi:VOC family protein [Uliginosibacterium gangwonense]|uniref:VOC family protein n=1 Tax=Uliginosibacterium gangwonense TaxID=392736 RepID=UPI000368E342|nr:VOC family protein [Uliginosibacterium gangwonense]